MRSYEKRNRIEQDRRKLRQLYAEDMFEILKRCRDRLRNDFEPDNQTAFFKEVDAFVEKMEKIKP